MNKLPIEIFQKILSYTDFKTSVELDHYTPRLFYDHNVNDSLWLIDNFTVNMMIWVLENTPFKVSEDFLVMACRLGGIDLIKWIIVDNNVYTYKAFDEAVKRNSPGLIAWFIKNGYKGSDTSISYAIKNFNDTTLYLLYLHGYSVNSKAIKTAIESGNLDALIWIYSRDIHRKLLSDYDIIDTAIRSSNLDLIKWFVLIKKISCHDNVVKNAFDCDELDIAMWFIEFCIVERKYTDIEVIIVAGRLDILKSYYLHNVKNTRASYYAIENSRFEILFWLERNGYYYKEEAFDYAVKSNDRLMINYILKTHVSSCTKNALFYACDNKNIYALELIEASENGEILNEDNVDIAADIAARKGYIDILAIFIDLGFNISNTAIEILCTNGFFTQLRTLYAAFPADLLYFSHRMLHKALEYGDTDFIAWMLSNDQAYCAKCVEHAIKKKPRRKDKNYKVLVQNIIDSISLERIQADDTIDIPKLIYKEHADIAWCESKGIKFGKNIFKEIIKKNDFDSFLKLIGDGTVTPEITVIYDACVHGCVEVVAWCLTNRYFPYNLAPAIHDAIGSGNLTILKLLASECIVIDTESALRQAINTDDLDIIMWLYKYRGCVIKDEQPTLFSYSKLHTIRWVFSVNKRILTTKNIVTTASNNTNDVIIWVLNNITGYQCLLAIQLAKKTNVYAYDKLTSVIEEYYDTSEEDLEQQQPDTIYP